MVITIAIDNLAEIIFSLSYFVRIVPNLELSTGRWLSNQLFTQPVIHTWLSFSRKSQLLSFEILFVMANPNKNALKNRKFLNFKMSVVKQSSMTKVYAKTGSRACTSILVFLIHRHHSFEKEAVWPLKQILPTKILWRQRKILRFPRNYRRNPRKKSLTQATKPCPRLRSRIKLKMPRDHARFTRLLKDELEWWSRFAGVMNGLCPF